MSTYSYQSKNIRTYLKSLYDEGLKESNHLTNLQVEEILTNIGIFKFKGYYFAFRDDPSNHTIDDILLVYFFDKYLTRIIMDITSSIETKLKTTLVELCYKQIKDLPAGHIQKYNPFFYLIKSNYNDPRIKLTHAAVRSWEETTPANATNLPETYNHYGLYYKLSYNFPMNRAHYLNGETLIGLPNPRTVWDAGVPTTININYPPFHYLIESATLGSVIYMTKKLKLFGTYDLLEKVSEKFGITNINIDFLPYLERLNEIRNRAAHRERIFNRSYRSINRTGHFRTISSGLRNHKFMDVYMFLFLMTGKLNHHGDTQSFVKDEIERLFKTFKTDYYIRHDSKMLTKKVKRKDFEKIKGFILSGMN